MEASEFQREILQMERLLYRVAWSYLNNLPDVEDAVQETLVKAWRNREKLRDSQQFRPWICRILINQCRDMIREHKRKSFFSLENVADQLQYQDNQLALLEIVQGLSPDLRVVMTLYYVEDYTTAEIARMLHIPVGTVKTRMRSARKQLRKALRSGEENVRTEYQKLNGLSQP